MDSKYQSKITNLNGLEETFVLKNFNAFVNSLPLLASEANKDFSVLLNALNDLCDIMKGITVDNIRKSIIEWYSNTTMASTDIIRAKSKYYNAPAFSDVTISMNTDDVQNYIVEETCFGKVN